MYPITANTISIHILLAGYDLPVGEQMRLEVVFQSTYPSRGMTELERSGIEVTMKIRIAQYKKINSQCMCMIDGEMHRVYNAAHITNKDGFPETELTLIKPDKKMEILK